MHKTTLITTLLILLPVPAFAQDEMQMPTPAAHMANFEPLLGTWQGKGVHRESADGEAMPWTATMSFTKIIGGFAVQEDLVIDVGAPTKLLMRTVYGHDSETGRSIAVNMNNQGKLHAGDFAFADAGTLLVYGATQTDAGYAIGRGKVEFTKDSYRFRHEGCMGAGKFFTEVEGSFTRAADASAEYVSNASFMDMPTSDEMKALEPFLGSYEVKGSMIMAPGMEPMQITGTETYSSMWGGQILTSEVVGEAGEGMPAYIAHSYAAWSPVKKAYELVVFENMGFAGTWIGRWTKPGTEFVNCSAMTYMGQMVASNTIVTVGKKGIESVKANTVSNASEPYVSFRATYTRKQ